MCYQGDNENRKNRIKVYYPEEELKRKALSEDIMGFIKAGFQKKGCCS